MRVFNKRTRIVEDTLNIRFLENVPNVIGNGPDWLFDVDSLTISMNYVPIVAGNQTNGIAGTRDNIITGQVEKKTKPEQEYILIPICTTDPLISQSPKDTKEDTRVKPTKLDESEALDKDGKDDQATRSDAVGPSFTNDDPSSPINAARTSEEHLFEQFSPFKNAFTLPDVPNVFLIDDTGIFGNAYDDEDMGAEADLNNLETSMNHPIVTIPLLPDFGGVTQMDVKSAFLYGTIKEDVYVCQPPGFEDSQFPDKVYKVEKALYGLHQAPKAWYETLSTYLIENGFRRGTIDKTLFIKKDKGDISLVQVYVDDIIFRSTKKSLCDEFESLMHKRFQMSSIGELTFFLGLQTASTPMEPNKALVKDEEADSVDVHLYRSMIGSLMYLTASRPDITFAVCACARDSKFDLKAFSDSDYAGAGLDRKSTTGGCQFLGKRLISWQCKKQTIVANSTTEAEYVAAANCCRQVLWIQNQMLDYGFNFMNTKIYIDNESSICIVKNLVFHSKTKHIEIRHYFIRDSYEKRLIQVFKDGFDGCIGLKMLFRPVLRVKHGKKLVSATKLALCYWAKILDFLTSSSINFALAVVVVSESSVRRDLHLNDEDGTACLTTNEFFENLALMGYEPASDKLTFYKGLFSPQWKYLIHTILHCLSSKSTSWDQFSINLASAIICLEKGQKFNFSKLIFDGMLRNLDPKKFLMYPRFLQLFFNIQLPNLVIPFNDVHETPKLTKKVFTNMRKPGKGFSDRVTPLFQNMLVPPVVVGKGLEQPPEPQPTPSTAPPEVLSQVGDEAINEEMFDSVERAVTTASSLEAEQASGNINKTQFTATLNEPFFLELGSGSGPWRQETMGGMQAQTRSEGVSNLSSDPPLSGGHTLGSGEDSMEHQIELTDNVPNTPHDSPLPGVNTPGSDEGSLELNELMDLVTKLSHRVFDLEKVKTAQAKEIACLKRRVSKLEQRQRSRILKNHPFRFSSSKRQSLGKKYVSNQGRNHLKTQLQFGEYASNDIDDLVDNGTAFVQEKDAENQGKIGADDTEVVTQNVPETVNTAAPKTPPTTTTVFDDEDVTMAMAQTLINMKEEKAKEKGFVIKDVEESSRPETEFVDKTNKKVQGDAQMERDAEVALRLQAELDKELRVERQRQEKASKVTIAEMFDEDVTKEEAAEYEKEKEELRLCLKIISNDDSEVDYKPLSKKFPIVNWEYQLLGKMEAKDMLVQGRFQDHPLEGHDLLLWGDLRMIFDPDEKDELWMNQLDWKLLRWKLYESCKVHTLFMDGTSIEINMLVEKKYHLIKELLKNVET
ncbi:putative ribonuclease H-like domain-containing protein [Tanacetum coccineum]